MMMQIYALVILLVGLPIFFSIQVLLHASSVFVYIAMAIVLLSLMSFKNLFLFKLNNINLTFLIIYLILLTFLIIGIISNADFKQLRDIAIMLWIITATLTFKQKDKLQQGILLRSVFYISLFSVIMIYISTPIDVSYWALHGGRIYIGETNNPNLVAWVVSMNIISIFFYLYKYTMASYVKLFFVIVLLGDVYLFFLAQSKSSFIGLILILIFYLLRARYKVFFYKQFYIFLMVIVSIFIFYSEKILEYIKLIYETFVSLFYGNGLVMSADIRSENFQKTIELLNIDNFFGYGINTFRMDSPILQVFIDFGYFFGIYVLILLFIIPMFKIYFLLNKPLGINEEFAVVIYLFFLPNLFFHGTPYEWNVWLPTLIFYIFHDKSIYFKSKVKR